MSQQLEYFVSMADSRLPFDSHNVGPREAWNVNHSKSPLSRGVIALHYGHAYPAIVPMIHALIRGGASQYDTLIFIVESYLQA